MDIPQAVIPQAALAEGEMTTCVVNSVDLLICHVQGKYYAMLDQCSHARQKLSTGRLRGYEITCPLHAARFDVRNGNVLAAPAMRGVKTFPVTLEGGKVCVTVSDDDKPSVPKPPGMF